MARVSTLNPDLILSDIEAAERRILEEAERLDEAGLRAPSTLPGWSRAHVLAHLTTLGRAFMRQLEYASRGETIEVYNGGPAGREAGIQTAAALPIDGVRAELAATFEGLRAAWPGDEAGWRARVSYRGGIVFDLLETWWRETRIHLLDLDLAFALDSGTGRGDGFEGWNREFCLHLWSFLDARLEGPAAYLLVATDDPARLEVNPAPDAEVVHVSGTLRDLAAWLAGRAPDSLPQATIGGADLPLPELAPWPSGRPAPTH
jgi:maleylpyruvate isomerase